MRYLASIFIVLLFSACSQLKTLEYAKVKDLTQLPQEGKVYTEANDTNISISPTLNDFEKSYFKPWNTNKISTNIQQIQWPFFSYNTYNSYRENLMHPPKEWFDAMYKRGNFTQYATLSLDAISVDSLNLRGMPTDKPLFKNPNQAGEGFPFDYLQNSSVHPNEPLVVSHYSDDHAWVYVFTAYASGWVHANEIAFVSEQDIQKFELAKKIYIITDGYPLQDKDNQFLAYSRVGMILPLLEEVPNGYTALFISRDETSKPIYKEVFIPKIVASSSILKFNQQNIAHISDEMLKSTYGWGGMFQERDCSAMTKDFFTPFGIWLPRNSAQQAKVGKIVSLKSLSDDAKRKIIKEQGVAFQTLLYMHGHILIYAGVYNNKIIVLHDMWGIRTKNGSKTGRILVGKTVFSTLEIGKELKFTDPNNTLLKKVESMNILTRP